MIVYFVLFIGLCLYGIKLKPDESGFQSDYMSVDKTASIKGIFIIIVFFSHFAGYVDYTWSADVTFQHYFSMTGQRMVTLFMFFSGYGVTESFAKKGMKYIHALPKKRILHVLVEFDIAVVIFTIMKLIMGQKFRNGTVFNVSQFLLSLTGWDSVGNSNWYIFAVLVAYIATFIGFEIFREKKYFSVGAVTVLLGVFIVVFRIFDIKPAYWYNTVICYAAGMWYSLLRPVVERVIMRNAVYYPVTVVTVGLCLWSFRFADVNFVLYEVSMLLFAAVFILVSMKISVHNKVLMWLGKNLFGMYIFQRLPMTVFDSLGLADFNIYLYFAVCMVCTVMIAYGFGKLTKLMWSPKKTRITDKG